MDLFPHQGRLFICPPSSHNICRTGQQPFSAKKVGKQGHRSGWVVLVWDWRYHTTHMSLFYYTSLLPHFGNSTLHMPCSSQQNWMNTNWRTHRFLQAFHNVSPGTIRKILNYDQWVTTNGTFNKNKKKKKNWAFCLENLSHAFFHIK